jgi:Helix-turn-helix domain
LSNSIQVVSSGPDKPEILFADPYSRLISKRELSRFLGKHPNTIDVLRAKKIIPWYRIGGSVMFSLKEVEEALKRYRVREVRL